MSDGWTAGIDWSANIIYSNIGVLQTTIAELITVKEHQPRAYVIMPFMWSLGSILGPAMGGALAQPSKTFPNAFPPGSLFDTFPFLLPNLICVVILLCGITIGILFLEETHSEVKHRHDAGREAGQWILKNVKSLFGLKTEYVEIETIDKDAHMLMDDTASSYRSSASTPRMHASRPNSLPSSGSSTPRLSSSPYFERKRAMHQRTFSRQVILTIIAYGVLA
jgi:MFS family permease